MDGVLESALSLYSSAITADTHGDNTKALQLYQEANLVLERQLLPQIDYAHVARSDLMRLFSRGQARITKLKLEV